MSRAGRAMALWCVLILTGGAICVGQDVPEGVNYKKTSALVNAKAKTAMEQALASATTPTEFLSGTTIGCGPTLWNDLTAHHVELEKDSTPVTMMISIGESIKADGRGFRTQEQRDRFWQLVMEKFPDLRKGKVRTAKPSEISYYWATIPFDIVEPFFAIDTPENVFIVNLTMQKEVPLLFTIDRVDDLRKLKK